MRAELAFGVVILAMGLLTAPATTVASSPNDDSSSVQAATYSYSTGRSGGRLKWLPQRPTSVVTDSAVKPAAHTAPDDTSPYVRTAQNRKPTSPFGDPFGEKKGVPTPAPATKLGDDLLPPTQPKLQEPLPEVRPNEPNVMEKSLSAPNGLAPLKQPQPGPNHFKSSVSDRDYAPTTHEFKEGCPSPKDLKHISDLTTNITPSEGELPHDCPLGNVAARFEGRSFAPITYRWTASGLCHKPLYFEDVQLERYGHMGGPLVQPFASAAHFFLTIPILPYKMGLEPPNECLYTLGYYRPGDCAPYLFDPIPISVRGLLFEGGAWVGAVAMFPGMGAPLP